MEVETKPTLARKERENYYSSLIPPEDSIIPRGAFVDEQSTVTVLVASAFCCCFLFLGCVAAAAGYFFLLIWGILILDDADSATSGSCEDAYHIWTFCLLNEFVGLAVTVCGCQEACRIYSNMSTDNDGGTTLGCPFYSRYAVSILIAFSFFFWGMVEWFSLSDSCIDDYNKKYEALLLLFRTGVIADSIILLITVTSFVVQRHASKTDDTTNAALQG